MYNTLESIHQPLEKQSNKMVTVKKHNVPFLSVLIGFPILIPGFLFVSITVVMFPFACIFGWL